MIIVGASTSADTIWYINSKQGSNYGQERVDLFAPGVNIYSTMSTSVCLSPTCKDFNNHYYSGYHKGMGTFYAAPFVTGVASLIMSKYPNLSIAEVKERILSSVDVRSGLIGKCATDGRLNAYKAVHDHFYNGTYEYAGLSNHKVYCSCGVFSYAPHTWINTGDMMICSGCGYMEYY